MELDTMRAGSPATKEATEGDPLRPVERKRRRKRKGILNQVK